MREEKLETMSTEYAKLLEALRQARPMGHEMNDASSRSPTA